MASSARPSRPGLPGGVAFGVYALHLWAIGGIAASNILMAVSALVAIGERRWRPLASPALVLPLRLLAWFAFAFVLSIAFSYEPMTSARRLDDLLNLLPLLLTFVYVEEEAQARLVAGGMVAVGALLAVYGLGQMWVGTGGLDLGHRIPGPFSHYQTFAGVLLLCDVLGLALLTTARGRRRLWLVLALLLINVALFANLTRGVWVALVLSLLFLVAWRAPRYLLAAVPALVVVAFVVPGPVRDRASTIFDLQNESNYDRLCMVYAGAHMVVERPLFGLGPELVEERYPLYRHPTAPRDRRPHLHNSYLQIAAESGLVSLVLFLGLLGGSLFAAVRGYRREGGPAGPRADLYLGAAAALVAYTFAALFEDNWTDTEVQRVALFIVALPFCLDRLREDS
ncbi:MAG: O-antigen ligase family protein [Thermoanaerobaculia bacterium]|nr:O-antigen ligase family protein [Thermoanaerobaculia bacterium]